MRYIVVLDAQSHAGKLYANGNNDGMTAGEGINHQPSAL